MFDNEEEGQLAQAPSSAPGADGENKAALGDYKVGKYRPPLEKRFTRGRSGNPKGRPRGRRNTKTIVERVLEEPVSVRLGDKTRTLPMLEAIVYAQAAKAAQGDVRSAGLVFNLQHKTGALIDSVAATGQETTALEQQAFSRSPSAELFENIDQSLLSADDKIELSRLAQIVDLGGGMTALSVTDFARAREIVNQGRGTDITPST
jgi:hypothetical protein